ncbi:hypothetical protein PHMEG_0001525, partial [Phytophthora megakarya]
RRREALLRLHTRFRWRLLHRGLETWKHYCCLYEYLVVSSCSTESAKVYPLSPDHLHVYQPSLLPRITSPHAKIVSNDNSQWQLLRKVWRHWERVVRWKRRHRELAKLDKERLLRLGFGAWKSRIRLLWQRRVLVRRIAARTRQRLQQFGLTRFRMRCAEVSVHEWAEVLKTAHTAMEEEKKLRSEVQSSAASELHAAYIREQHRQHRFTELQAQRLEDFKRRECKHRALMILRYEVIQTRQKNTIALRFQRLHHCQRLMRRLFTSWKRETGRIRHTKDLMAVWDARRTRSLMATCFRLFAWTIHRRRQQRRRLRTLISNLQRGWLLRGWLCLRIRSAMEDHKATAHVAMWQLSQQVDGIQTSCKEAIHHSRKIAFKYQMTCALFMADKTRETFLRKVLRSWSERVALNAQKRHALRRLLARREVKALRTATQKWINHIEQNLAQRNQVQRYHMTQRHRATVVAFDVWKRNMHEKLRRRLAKYRQRSCFRTWRYWYNFRRQRVQWIGRFQQQLMAKLQRHAFKAWKLQHDHYVKVCSRREVAEHELIARLWRRWNGIVTFRLLKRYLQTWHEHSALMTRRRVSLRRLYWRQTVRRLRSKWHHWIKASLCTAITILETSSITAQLQVDRVIQSTSRANMLRRTIQRWRRLTSESKRQQRRRVLFAEKRRYMMLQATLRQWQITITCCSLTKQRRVLQNLLNRFQLAVERQAFRRWERNIHAMTLHERDRISAELFRRSEIRVMVLAEQIRAERDRRVIFASWRSITTGRKRACTTLQIIMLKHHHRFLQNAWIEWTLSTRKQRCVVRLITIIGQRLKAAAWYKLVQMYQHAGVRSTGARLAGELWHKIRLRQAWARWKRIDGFLSKRKALREATASITQSMAAFKSTLASRHHRKQALKRILAAWKHHLSCVRRLQQHLRDALGRRAEATTTYHFHKWRKLVERHRRRHEFLYRIVKRRQMREVRSALARWRRWLWEMAHREQLEQTKRALLQQRQVSANLHVEKRRRYVFEQREIFTHRRKHRLLRSVWHSWYNLVHQSKRKAELLTKILNKMRTALVAHGFYRWYQWTAWMQNMDDRLIRLVRVHNLWQWRRGFSALRQYHQEDIRRQSVMAASAFSVHNTRQRERQTQKMRAVSLVLQRKSSTALCYHCFRHWNLYVKSKVKTELMIRMACARSRKQKKRRCFTEWQLHTRQNIIQRQKIHRRQETWQFRRQRRVWNAWVYITQHSLEVKHSIYDRLIIRALRNSLQGSWGRWKAYTRDANALFNEQRVAQWQSAAAERDKMMNTLEDKHECLLLRAAQLGQVNNTLRQRLISSGARKIHRVMKLRRKSRIETALRVWYHKLQQTRALQSRIATLARRYQQIALQCWHSSISQQRTAEKLERVQLDATEWAARVVHTYDLQLLRRRTFLSWKAIVRARRGIKRHIVLAIRWREFYLVRRCWATWKSNLDTRTQQQIAATALRERKEFTRILQAFWQWRRVLDRPGITKHNAIRTLSLFRRVCQHRLMMYGWHRWRNFVIEDNIAMLQTELVLTELGNEKAADHHIRLQLLLRHFSSWRMYARSEHERRNGYARALTVASHRHLLRRHLEYWRHRTASIQTRLILLLRMNRHLRRHYMTLTKFALWVWFCRAQSNYRSLTQLQVASKKFTPTIDVPARIARALLTDLLLAEHQLLRLKQRSAWRLANVTVRSARRRMLQTAFDRFTSGVVVISKRHFLTPTHIVNARAFVDRMTLILLRSGFQRWKQQYLMLAIQEAEEAQEELLRALHHVTSYRQALDPYATQS